jgi:hypothetical protein
VDGLGCLRYSDTRNQRGKSYRKSGLRARDLALFVLACDICREEEDFTGVISRRTSAVMF